MMTLSINDRISYKGEKATVKQVWKKKVKVILSDLREMTIKIDEIGPADEAIPGQLSLIDLSAHQLPDRSISQWELENEDSIETLTPDSDQSVDAIETLTPDSNQSENAIETLTPDSNQSENAIKTLTPDSDQSVDAIETLTPDSDQSVDAIETLTPDSDRSVDAIEINVRSLPTSQLITLSEVIARELHYRSEHSDSPPNSHPNSHPNSLPNSHPNSHPNSLPNPHPNCLPNPHPNSHPNSLPNSHPNSHPNPHPHPNHLPNHLPNSHPNQGYEEIKIIKGRKYRYRRWLENGKLRSKYLGKC